MDIKIQKMGRNSSASIDLTGMNALMRAVNQRLVTRVGILGDRSRLKQMEGESKTAFSKRLKIHSGGSGDVSQTNASIGLAHEKGVASRNLPRRSWLEVPLQDHLPEHFAKIGAEMMKKIVEENREQDYEELGIVAEQIIQQGFETGGYGKWPDIKEETKTRKGSSAILIDSGQLRKSITHDVIRP